MVLISITRFQTWNDQSAYLKVTCIRAIHSFVFAPFVKHAYNHKSFRHVRSVKRPIAENRPLMRGCVKADDSIAFGFMRFLAAK